MSLLEKLWARGKDFLGVRFPVISGAMTWISTFELVKAVCDNGGFGVLAGGNMPPEIFEREVDRCLAEIKTPLGGNRRTSAPPPPAPLEILERKNVPVVVFAGTIPAKPEIERMKAGGKKVMVFAPADVIARKMIKSGVDALIIEGSEAGGHIGHVSTLVLLQEILFKYTEVPVFVAGGIASGRMMAHLLLMGAAGVQLGTRFVMTEECQAHPEMKQAFCKAQARHAAASTQVDPRLPVVSVRALKNEACEEFAKLQISLLHRIEAGEISREKAVEQVENFWIGGLRKAVVDGDLNNGSLMAGQSVGLMDSVLPMAEVFGQVVAEAEEEWQRVRGLF